MFNVKQIICRHRKSFYNYSNGKRRKLYLNDLCVLALAAVLSFLFASISTNFLNALITVQAILLGFSFNVLFYLLANTRIDIKPETAYLEDKIKAEKLSTLAEELFNNVSYFNVVSVAVISLSLGYFLFDLGTPPSLVAILQHEKLNSFLPYASDAKRLATSAYKLLLFTLVIESFLTFLRTTGRVTYYFQERIELQK